MKTKRILIFIFSLIEILCTVSCAKQVINDPSADKSVRVTLYPTETQFTAMGKTEDGKDAFESVVTVTSLNNVNTLNWDASIVGDPAWASVTYSEIETSFSDIYTGKEYFTMEKGVRVTVNVNKEYKRKFTLRITVDDGSVHDFEMVQLGQKADAEVIPSADQMQFVAKGESIDLTYTTNMGDAVSYTAEYNGESKDWLSWKSDKTGVVTLTTTAWEDKINQRTADFIITVGDETTSLASTTVKIVQLANQDVYYIYGPSFDNKTLETSTMMTTKDIGVYSVKGYVINCGKGNNHIILSKNGRNNDYPKYALKDDGTIVELASSSSPIPEFEAVDIDGMRTFTVKISTKTWEADRVSTPNAMPDNEISKYKTMSYIARDGSERIWIVEHIRWDGGSIMPKLGSKMVYSAGGTATGSYSEKEIAALVWNDPTSWNPDNEEKSIGGNLEGDDSHGRIYAYSELMTGVPLYGLDHYRRAPMPDGFKLGDVVTDAVGNEITVEYITAADISGKSDAELDANHPILKWQIQGICPYGWHISNLNDWVELAYAVEKASVGASDYPVSGDVTYDSVTAGLENVGTWLKSSDWESGSIVAAGADSFGFKMYPIGYRYMTQGYQQGGKYLQLWINLIGGETQAYRMGSLTQTSNVFKPAVIDNGNAIMSFRCVKNYK